VRRLALLALVLSACARAGALQAQPVAVDAPVATERPFRMGFTTEPGGPAGGVKAARAPTLRFIRANGDIVIVHRDGPRVAWSALAKGRSKRFGRILARQRTRIGAGSPVFVLITPLNIFRNGIGGEWPDTLGPACISNSLLQIAFKNYALLVVETMRPDYLGLGAEVNMYRPGAGCPADDFDAYVTLYKETYHLVKAMRPDLPVFVTFQLDFLHLQGRQMLPARFMPELDRLALSFYPGGNLTRLTPDQIPPDYISWARAATDAPLVVSETGYGTVAAGGAVGSPELQAQYVQWLMAEADRQNAEFVTWFFASDPRYVKVPPGLDFINSFKSMGLATPRFQAKPALDVWRSWLALPLVPALDPGPPTSIGGAWLSPAWDDSSN
jgi:hypothetical protein